MSDEKQQKVFCLGCRVFVPADTKKCLCGCKSFIYGDNFGINNDNIVCGCGNEQFKMTFHLNRSPYHTYNYQCSKCGNTIGKESYSPSIWDDDYEKEMDET